MYCDDVCGRMRGEESRGCGCLSSGGVERRKEFLTSSSVGLELPGGGDEGRFDVRG